MQLRHTKLPSFWDSNVDSLAEVWKVLVTAIELSDGFDGVVSMILLMMPATRTRREAAKNDLKNGWWLLHKPSKSQNLPPNFCQLLMFVAILRSTKLLFTQRFRVVNHRSSTNQPTNQPSKQPPIDQVSNAFTQLTKFPPLPWPMSYSLYSFGVKENDII